MRFTQINMHRALNAAKTLHSQLGQSSQIGLITEPYTHDNKCAILPPGFKSIPRNALPIRPRAAIFHHPDTTLVVMEHLSNADCAVALMPGDRPLLIASIYLDIGKDCIPGWLEELVDFASRKSYQLLLAADTNAHTPLLGGEVTNARGELLEQFILSNSLMIHNEGDTPTFDVIRDQRRLTSYIDATISCGTYQILGWRVDSSYNGSDHNTILFEIPVATATTIQVRPWAKAKWDVFKRSLEEANLYTPESATCKKLDKMVTLLYRVLGEALDKACPLIHVRSK